MAKVCAPRPCSTHYKIKGSVSVSNNLCGGLSGIYDSYSHYKKEIHEDFTHKFCWDTPAVR